MITDDDDDDAYGDDDANGDDDDDANDDDRYDDDDDDYDRCAEARNGFASLRGQFLENIRLFRMMNILQCAKENHLPLSHWRAGVILAESSGLSDVFEWWW
ncbi:hypothetical protein ElyMa_004883300 [Elysia marginata]|uniref:Uncharacterized protein n=1 Tax=Elysia marginata TaxID=1093978 RepID=A0AAV4IVI2_9GAST|nr:hypothetical protein ElyMa_004883300 [Elysia marginata]